MESEVSLGCRKSFPPNQVPPTTTEGHPISNSPFPLLSAVGAGTQPHRGKMLKHSVSLSSGTCRELHFLEALDGWWDTIPFHQDVVLLPNTLMSLFRHAQDITWGCPTVGRQWAGEVSTVRWGNSLPSPYSWVSAYHRQSQPHMLTGKTYLVLIGSS